MTYTNVKVVQVLQPKLDSVAFLFRWKAHPFYWNDVRCDRYRTGCRMLGSNIFLCCKDEMDHGIWRSWRNNRLIIRNLGPLQLKENLESSSQLVKTIATHSPSEDCALAGVQEGWRSGSSGEVEKNPTGWKGLGISDIIGCNYYSTVYIIHDINLHYVYIIYILRIPLVNKLHV